MILHSVRAHEDTSLAKGYVTGFFNRHGLALVSFIFDLVDSVAKLSEPSAVKCYRDSEA